MADRDEPADGPAPSLSGADERRVRMSLALGALSLPEQLGRDDLARWLQLQPAPASPEADDPTALGVAVSAALDRVTWFGSGETDLFLSRVAEFFEDVNVPERELDLLSEVGSAILPERFGSWIEIRADSVDGGWLMEEEVPLEQALIAAPRAPLRSALLGWAEASGATECTWIRRSVAPPTPMTEYVIPLPDDSPAAGLALAQAAFAELQLPWLGDDVATAITESEPAGLALVVALTDEGASRAGVIVAGPTTELVLALAGATGGADDQALALWAATIGRAPGWLSCSRYADGFRADLYHWLSEDD